MTKIAVTGGTGFIGGHVVAQLLAAGDDVRVLVRDPGRLAPSLRDRVETRVVDLLDPAGMESALRGASTLFHVAGFIGGRPRERVWQLNAEAPRVATEAAARAGVGRVVLTSTCTSIGPARPGAVADETVPFRSLQFIYMDSKHAGEQSALHAASISGLELVVVNPGYVLGESIDPRHLGASSTRVIGNYLRGRLPVVTDARLSFVDVEDVARGHLLAARHGVSGERYLLAGENRSWRDVITRVRALSRVEFPVLVMPARYPRVLFRPTRPGREVSGAREAARMAAYDWSYSSAKAYAAFGYAPRPLEESLERTIAWYRRLLDAGQLSIGGAHPMARGVRALVAAQRTGLFRRGGLLRA